MGFGCSLSLNEHKSSDIVSLIPVKNRISVCNESSFCLDNSLHWPYWCKLEVSLQGCVTLSVVKQIQVLIFSREQPVFQYPVCPRSLECVV